MKAWTPEQIEEVRKQEGATVAHLEAAALLFLDQRDKLFCELSAVEGEWPDTGIQEAHERIRDLVTLQRLMKEVAISLVDEEDQDVLIWGVLDRICASSGYCADVWSRR